MKAYLTINQGDTLLGTLRLTLFPHIVPKTVDNFVHYLQSPTNNKEGYRNSTFHRIIPKFMAQGGDFIKGDGTGSASIYGSSFKDENFQLSHSQRGTLSMANSGADTNGCQFFITFKATAHLDGRHVVFGYVDWREDDESALVLEKMERVRTVRNDRPLETIRIVDCGIINEGKGTAENVNSEAGGVKLSGEEKKNKLLQAYGASKEVADDDEINLDEEEDAIYKNEKRDDTSSSKVTPTAEDTDEIDLDDENDEEEEAAAGPEEEVPTTGKLTKKQALKKRLAALKTKINQSRTLNRREVHAEATRMGTEEASMQHRKSQNKKDKNAKQKEYETYVVGKLNGGGEGNSSETRGVSKAEQKKMASLSQPAYDSIRQMHARADKKERSQHGPDDYYNPEGQFANYERNLTSVRHAGAPRRGEASLDSYDPTIVNDPAHAAASRQASISEKDGAARLASEMRRRAEKRNNKKRKIEFDAVDVTSINDRNKKFNQKIGRNFDQHTAEIRQNLERGTAL